MIPFEQTSYLAQVKRLRTLANEVLKSYPVTHKTIRFIKHGANTTFKVTAQDGKNYLLRIHPNDYHTESAILEEMKWLNYLADTTNLLIPKPIRSTEGHYVTQCLIPTVTTTRFCVLFEWLPGITRWKSINRNYAYHLGSMIGQLQKNGRNVSIKHRCYWSAEGLVGTEKATFFNIEKLTAVSKRDQASITQARRAAYRKLKYYETTYPEKIGLIHADMQPNNFLTYNNQFAAIDFDDCGVGLYGDDLAVALFAFEYLTENQKNKNYFALQEALFEGYSEQMPFTEYDVSVSPYFLLARSKKRQP